MDTIDDLHDDVPRSSANLPEETAVDVGGWLRTLGLERYMAAFCENGVSGDVLFLLTADDLKEMGVAAVGDRRRLLAAIATLRESAATSRAIVEAPGARPLSAVSERRQITVLFCDIVGSATLSARLDPEDLREVLVTYQATVAEEVAGKHGYIARFVGDGVLAYFGWPNADEAHAESAVRAGLGIIEAVRPQRLSVRIGIATGLVVTSDLIGVGAAQTVTAIGETPNIAARLQALAEPDAVVASHTTRSHLGQMFEWEDLGYCRIERVRQADKGLACAAGDGRNEPIRGRSRDRACGLGRPAGRTGPAAAPLAGGAVWRGPRRVAFGRARYR